MPSKACETPFYIISRSSYYVLLGFQGNTIRHCRSECDIANKHTAQCAAQTGQLLIALRKQLLALSIRQSHQIMGPFFLPPSHVLVTFFLARAKRAASAARGAEPLYIIYTYIMYTLQGSLSNAGVCQPKETARLRQLALLREPNCTST